MSIPDERDHQERWYRQAIDGGFFEREGFRRLVAWNLEHLLRSVPFRRDMHVLSLGCGLGDYELALAPRVARIDAVDLSETAVAEARRRAAAAGLSNVEFRVADLDRLDLPAGRFDAVYALGTLHHLPADARRSLLGRVAAWLKPDGWLYARDPNARGLLRRLAQGFWRRADFHSAGERPIDPRELLADVRAAGFTRETIDYTDVLGGPLPWVLNAESRLVWSAVSAFDRIWLATPGLRALASQFSLTARRPPRDD